MALVDEAPPAGGQAPPTAESGRRFRLASPRTAVVLGALTLVLAVTYMPLAYPARDVSDGWDVLLALLAFAVPGVVVARRQPGNPIGWILIGLGMLGAFYTDAARYAVFDYHFHHGDLPFGPAAALVAQALWGTGQFLVLPVVILLFPDGRLTRRWRVALWAYVAAATVFAAAYFHHRFQMAGHPVSVSGNGEPVNESSPPAALAWPGHALLIILAVFWVSFAARQVLIWRRARGGKRGSAGSSSSG